ncbi:MAG TPA: DUF3040 domain-containing protein [Acidimicrobiales bacterium]|nr:DUF3040 domain-containing protein [Acidimicrobiales bacterium]
MPLSEDEQRILHEIERSFYEHDPEFARGVRETTLYRHAGRNCKWAAAGFFAGLVLLVFSFYKNSIVGFLAFVIMLFCALTLERNFRKMGKAGWSEFTQSVKAKGFPNVLGDTRKRLGKRFKRDGNP